MRVNVTEKHIRNGKPTYPEACPVALAVMDATGKKKVSVLSSGIKIEKGIFVTPPEVSDWISNYDVYQVFKNMPDWPKPEPFSFELNYTKKPFWKFWA